ncbi:MAG TPA: ABC transporter permease [Pyrinomonadaceae bacterium]|jgi:putative ABC transport system permease protein|nr:ABC transporter permease [Pyrinomonadaceae bacterium]
MGTILQDLRYGVRVLIKNPGFTLIAIIALALGIGANTAIFSVVNAVLLRPLPFEDSERLVNVWSGNAKRGIKRYPTSYPNFADWRDQNRVFEHMAAYGETSVVLSGIEASEQIDGQMASGDLFKVLGVKAALGRVYSREDEESGSLRVAVISHDLWQRRFGADPKVVGRQIMLDGNSFTLLGVMPQGFSFPLGQARDPQFWAPLNPKSETNMERGANYLGVAARLRPDVSLQQAQAEMDTIARKLEQDYPEKNTGRSINLVTMYEGVVGNIRPSLFVLLGAVGFVLLIACANVANLLLARGASRQKEIAIRTALGARRSRIVRQLLTESLLLSICAGAVGLLIALWGVDLLGTAIPVDIPRVKDIGLDSRVLGFTVAVSLLTGLIFGLAPALSTSKTDLNETLKEGGRSSTQSIRRNRVRSLLVVSEVALSLVLLVGAGLLIRSFLQLQTVNPGFDPHNVLTASIALPSAKYAEERQQAEFFNQLLERAAAQPGVQTVGITSLLPLSGQIAQNVFNIEGRPPLPPGERLTAHARVISPEYLRALGIPLLKGRNFSSQDTSNAPKVLIINETLARRYFPGEDPIGKRVTPTIAENFTAEIIGIVGDVRHMTLDTEVTPEFYVSHLQLPQPYMTIVARAAESSNAASLTAGLRSAVQQVDADQPLSDVRTMEQVLADSTARRRFNTLLLGLFASLALVLAAVGIFGVMSYSVTQRTHEIGIRMALGARESDVLRMIVGQGMILAVIGLAVGLAAAFGLTRLMSSLLYGVSATDPLTFAGVSLLLAAVALVASYIPARRATKVDPMVALRYE